MFLGFVTGKEHRELLERVANLESVVVSLSSRDAAMPETVRPDVHTVSCEGEPWLKPRKL
jgi:wyosine [tRNA(Phe)-imidazoG37] synthetase (radical SAM superfamily)